MTGKSGSPRKWHNPFLLLCCALATACSGETPQVLSEATIAPQKAVAAAAVAAPPEVKPAVAVQNAADSVFAVRGILNPDRPLRHGDFLWNDDGVPPGPISVVVDLKAQVVYVYRGGVEIGRSAILYGADDKPTPTGTFPILQKKKDHISNLYGAPMPYMLRLTNDGIAIHGSNVEYGAATHGCVGVPDDFAAKLFALAKVGDRVLVTNRWRTDVYGT